jgi:hypothetical protein
VVILVTGWRPLLSGFVGFGNAGLMATVSYRLPSRLEALAAAALLRISGHHVRLPGPPLTNAGRTIVVTVTGEALLVDTHARVQQVSSAAVLVAVSDTTI